MARPIHSGLYKCCRESFLTCFQSTAQTLEVSSDFAGVQINLPCADFQQWNRTGNIVHEWFSIIRIALIHAHWMEIGQVFVLSCLSLFPRLRFKAFSWGRYSRSSELPLVFSSWMYDMVKNVKPKVWLASHQSAVSCCHRPFVLTFAYHLEIEVWWNLCEDFLFTGNPNLLKVSGFQKLKAWEAPFVLTRNEREYWAMLCHVALQYEVFGNGKKWLCSLQKALWWKIAILIPEKI